MVPERAAPPCPSDASCLFATSAPTVVRPTVVEQAAGGWALRSLHAAAAGLTVEASALVEQGPWRCRDLVATVAADLHRLKPGLQGRVQATLRGDLPMSSDWARGSLALSVSGSDVVIAGTACTPLRLEVAVAAGVIRLQAREGGWGGIQARLAGEPTAMPEAVSAGWHLLPRPIALAGGLLSLEVRSDAAGSLSGEAHLDGLPLAQLPFDTGLRHLQGVASATLRLGGTLAVPTWTGELRLDDVEAKLSADIPTVTAGRARLIVEPGLLTVTEVRGDMGGAELTATGRIRLDGGGDALALTCQGRNLLLVQRPDARVRADLDLRLDGPLASPLLSGDVVVGSALITPELHPGGSGAGPADDRIILFELPDPPLSTLRFAIQVRSTTDTAADRGVRVVTRWGRGTCDLDLRLGGTGALPAPEGRVRVRDGIATLPFSTLKVTHGELVFPPGDPFQPRLTATAGARVRTYDVQAQVTGTLSQPVIRVTGSGLDEQEALMLLTTGSTPRELQDPQGQKAALGRVGVWLGQEAWRDLERLDEVEDGPSRAERLVITWGRERSGQGRDTIDSEVELTAPGSAPAVLLYGKRDRYDQYNAGVILRLSWGGEEP
jgi:autotransporter translocation and assembly factor TamB